MKGKKKSALGSSFDSWLDEEGEGFKAEVLAGAMKRYFVHEVREAMKKKGMRVTTLQRLLCTGPSQVQRLLDPDDLGISLKSIAKVTAVLRLPGAFGLWPTAEQRKKAA